VCVCVCVCERERDRERERERETERDKERVCVCVCVYSIWSIFYLLRLIIKQNVKMSRSLSNPNPSLTSKKMEA
jgi:hypothetical protein